MVSRIGATGGSPAWGVLNFDVAIGSHSSVYSPDYKRAGGSAAPIHQLLMLRPLPIAKHWAPEHVPLAPHSRSFIAALSSGSASPRFAQSGAVGWPSQRVAHSNIGDTVLHASAPGCSGSHSSFLTLRKRLLCRLAGARMATVPHPQDLLLLQALAHSKLFASPGHNKVRWYRPQRWVSILRHTRYRASLRLRST